MIQFRASDIEMITVRSGDSFNLESLRLTVIPINLGKVPFIEIPPFIKITGKEDFPGEGVIYCVYTLKAIKAGNGTLQVGFKDNTKKIVLEKTIQVKVSGRLSG